MNDERGSLRKKLEDLRKSINYQNYRYYVLDSPVVSDLEYDRLMVELKDIETQHPEWITPDSPTQRLSGQVSDRFEKVTHPAPILSLSNAFSPEDVAAWVERISKLDDRVERYDFVIEPKFDGLSVVLHYRDGIFVQGATRGNGEIGEDITPNLRTIKSIPLQIPVDLNGPPAPAYLVVRGEIYLRVSEFEKLNSKLEEAGEKTYLNPRNTASGSLRQLDSTVTAERPLEIIVYSIVSGEGQFPQHQWDTLGYLESFGFPVSSFNVHCKDLNCVFREYEIWLNRREKIDFEIDGLVVKINDLVLAADLGIVGKDPRGATALKFPALEVSTKLLEIGVNVGRTGVLTPYAVLEPVEVGGVIVKQATLHNFDFIANKDIRIGDRVMIKRAGDVIPYVIGHIMDVRDGTEKAYLPPPTCPSCHQDVEKIEGEVAWYCVNSACPAQLIRNLEHFVSRSAMDIVGLGIRIVKQLVSEGLLSDAADLYILNREDLLQLEGFADKKADNILDAINNSKNQSLDRFINALGIRGIGEVTAADLASKFKTIDHLMDLTEDQLIDIEGIGPNISKGLIDWFSRTANVELLSKFKKAGVWPIVAEQSAVDDAPQLSALEGLNFVVTGTLADYSRSEIKQMIQKNGGKISTSISRKTDYVIVGENPGSKLAKARDLEIRELDQAALLALIQSGQEILLK